METARVISLVECEILRKISLSKLCGEAEARQHLEVAEALKLALYAYRENASVKTAGRAGLDVGVIIRESL